MSGPIEGPAGPLAVLPAKPVAPKAASAKSRDMAVAAREFEQIFVRSMLKSTPIAGKGDVYGDLAVDAMAKSVTAGRGLGLGDLIRHAIEKSEAHPVAAGPPRSPGILAPPPEPHPLPSKKDALPLKTDK